MGKPKKRSGNRNKRMDAARSRMGRRGFLLGSAGVVAAGIAAGFGVYRLSRASRPGPPAKPFGPDDLTRVPRYETRRTLPPALFMGKAAAAYGVAKRIPALLDQLYCYCRCKENFGHKSLLSCYADRHAST